MELRDIDIFLVLAEELPFGRAAERLYVSVSAGMIPGNAHCLRGYW